MSRSTSRRGHTLAALLSAVGVVGGCSAGGETPVVTTNTGDGGSVTSTSSGSDPVTLSVTKDGDGDGVVTSYPAAIDCGPTCSATVERGDVVALVATPLPGSAIVGYAGGCTASPCQLTMNEPKSVTVSFGRTNYLLTAKVVGDGKGTVTSEPPGIDCGTSCSATYDSGSSVSLTPIADSASAFAGWAEDCTGNADCTLAMEADRTATASFISRGGDFGWAHGYGDVGNDEGRGIAADSAGNAFATGLVEGVVDFGAGPTFQLGVADNTFVAKFSPLGVCSWSKRFGAADNAPQSSQGGRDVATDPDGDVVVVGPFGGTTDFGAGVVAADGISDAFVLKLSGSSGEYMWSKIIGGSGEAYPTSVAVDGNGDVLVVGFVQGWVDFGAGATYVSDHGVAFLAKLGGADGTLQWAFAFPGGISMATSVATDLAGNIYLAGDFDVSMDIDGTALTAVPSVNGSPTDAFVASFTAGGALRWAESFGGTDVDTAYAVGTDAAGGVFVAGDYESPTVMVGPDTWTSAGGPDMFLMKLDVTNGSYLWSRSIGGTADEWAWDLAVDVYGNVAIAGQFSESVDFGGGTLTVRGAAPFARERHAAWA